MGWYVSKQALQPALLQGEGSRRSGEGISSAGIAPKTRAWVWVPPLPTRVGSRTASGMKERGFGCSGRGRPTRGPFAQRLCGKRGGGDFEKFAMPGFLFPF